MRGFLIFLAIVALVVAALIGLGIISISRTNDQVNITVDQGKIEKEVDAAVHHSGEALEKAGHDLQHKTDSNR